MPGEAERSSAPLSRRRLLQWGLATTVGLPLLAACSPAAPAAPTLAPTSASKPTSAPAAPAPTSAPAAAPQPTTAPAAANTAAPKPAATGVFPTYQPYKASVKADFPSAGPLYEDAFVNYPRNNPASTPADPPGLGSNVSATTIALFPPPTPYDQNPAWQAVNKALNANVQFEIVALGDYATRMATLMASGNPPDLTFFFNGITNYTGLPQYLESQAADLTPYLAGDAILDYPNLAAIPTFAWKNSGSVYNGKVLMVPKPSYSPGFPFYINQQAYESEVGKGYQPKDADDYKRVLKALTKPSEGFYGTGSGNDSAFWVVYYSACFGAPNNWRLNADGSLTKNFETPEFKEAVGYVRDLFAAGVYHPDSLQYSSGTVARAAFAEGKWAVWCDGFNVAWADTWRRAKLGAKPFDVAMLPPWSAHPNIKPANFLTTGMLGGTGLKKSSPDRTKELLRILNYLAAPFGSAEDLLMTFGVPGTDYNLDANGNPVVTDRGNQDANYTPWKYVANHVATIYQPDLPGFAQAVSDAEKVLIPIGVADPTVGFVSPAAVTKNFSTNKTMTDKLLDIIAARAPLSDFDGAVADWRSGGGDQMRTEFQAAIAKGS